MIVLEDEHALAQVHPEEGAAIGRYELKRGSAEQLPIFQPAASPERPGPFAHGLNLLVPFSNRISGGGFWHEGIFRPLERNGPGPYPIHGNAFQLPWSVREAAPNRAVLTLASKGPGPFAYDADVAYSLAEGALTVRLTVVNRAPFSLPYGAGLHPWFVRTPQTRLSLKATGYWSETIDHLPDAFRPVSGDESFDFRFGRLLPEHFFNTALTGWDGLATLEWPERALALDVEAASPLSTAILYSPSARADYVCIEPVSHSVDAHNRRDEGTALPQLLQSGDALAVEATFRPRST